MLSFALRIHNTKKKIDRKAYVDIRLSINSKNTDDNNHSHKIEDLSLIQRRKREAQQIFYIRLSSSFSNYRLTLQYFACMNVVQRTNHF